MMLALKSDKLTIKDGCKLKFSLNNIKHSLNIYAYKC